VHLGIIEMRSFDVAWKGGAVTMSGCLFSGNRESSVKCMQASPGWLGMPIRPHRRRPGLTWLDNLLDIWGHEGEGRLQLDGATAYQPMQHPVAPLDIAGASAVDPEPIGVAAGTARL
jgi:hypothetical protein